MSMSTVRKANTKTNMNTRMKAKTTNYVKRKENDDGKAEG